MINLPALHAHDRALEVVHDRMQGSDTGAGSVLGSLPDTIPAVLALGIMLQKGEGLQPSDDSRADLDVLRTLGVLE